MKAATAKKPGAKSPPATTKQRQKPASNPGANEPAAEWVPLSKLRLWTANPRKNDGEPVERVVAWIKEFGWGAPIVARRANGEIIAGHTRFKAADVLVQTYASTKPAERAKWHPEAVRVATRKEAPTRLIEISERKAHLLALADNRGTELTPWSDTLSSVLSEFSLDEAALVGWDEDELAELAEQMLDDDDSDVSEGGSEADDEDEQDDGVLRFDVFSVDAVAAMQAMCMLGKRCSDYALSAADVMLELNRCAAGGKPRVTITDRWFPHRYDVKAGNSPCTPNESLSDAEAIKGCVRMMAEPENSKRPITSGVLQCLSIYRGRQVARQFPIHIARDIYSQYSKPDARVLDPCAGWGGRLLGWLCARQSGSYFGVDASAATCASFERMLAELQIGGASVKHGAFEEVELPFEAFDFAFTSPPYFDVERYSDDAEQSIVRYRSYKAWRTGFLEPLVRKTLAALKPGCAFVLNVSDAGEHTIAKDAVRFAEAAGADVETRTTLDIGAGSSGAMNTQAGNVEDMIVLRKRGKPSKGSRE